MSLVSLIAFIVVIVSHAALYVWALSYRPLTRDFRAAKTLQVAPDYVDAMFNLALLLQRKNQYTEASDYWRRYLAIDC